MLRIVVGGSYAWLYRNDREWLDQNLPEKVVSNIRSSRVDWKARDAMLACRVPEAVRRLTETVGRKPVTSARIVAALCSESTARVNASRLPEFWTAVRTNAETQRQFKSGVDPSLERAPSLK